MRLYILMLILIFSSIHLFAQNGNVGINTSAPHSSAALDVISGDKGVLVPRISLTATNVASPVITPANALLVYNLATSGDGEYAVVPGFYYWSTTRHRWVAMNEEPVTDNGFGPWGDCTGSAFTHYNPVSAPVINSGNHGYSVALDESFAIGGAPYDSSGGHAYAGSAWIYQRNGQTWTNFQELNRSDPETFQLFGISVAIEGDYAVVGTAGDDESGLEDVGAVYIFHFNGTSWVQQTKIEPEEIISNMLFGYDVAIDSHRVVIGAPGAHIGGESTGAVYIYERTGSTWIWTQVLISSDLQPLDHLGYAVAACDDVVLVGAPRADVNGETNAGAAYFFRYSAGSWEETQKKQAPSPHQGDEFGRAVSMNETHSIIGAPGLDINSNNQQGGAFMYKRQGHFWNFQQAIRHSEGNAGDEFGASVSVDGIYAVIGAPASDIEDGSYCGEVTVFTDIGGMWKRLAQDIIDPTCASGDQFGLDVALRQKQFMIGAPGMLEKGLVVFGKL